MAKLADFGVAHLAGDEPLTRTGDVVGTLAYMAPEQAAGQRVDERADLYSLALVLYEALAGTNPVRAGSPAATARRVGTVLPAAERSRKDLPAELCAAIDRALRPRPEERGTLDELAAELADGAAGGLRRAAGRSRGTRSSAPSRSRSRARRPRRRRRCSPAACRRRAGAGRAAGRSPALAAVLAVALLPRLGWLATAAAAIGRARGRAARARRCWSPRRVAARPAAAATAAARRGRCPRSRPLLGLATLAGAYPALAGRARGWFTRAALGALGAWWALLAAPLLDEPRRAGPADADAALDGVSRAAAHERRAALRRPCGRSPR